MMMSCVIVLIDRCSIMKKFYTNTFRETISPIEVQRSSGCLLTFEVPSHIPNIDILSQKQIRNLRPKSGRGNTILNHSSVTVGEGIGLERFFGLFDFGNVGVKPVGNRPAFIRDAV